MLAPNKDYVDLSKPTIEGLIYALRHKEVWPADFRWCFRYCYGCAIGLASRLWGRVSSEELKRIFGLTERERQEVFFDVENRRPLEEVTPEIVAKKLGKIAAQKE